MQSPATIIMQFSRMTGIRDPNVDAWFGNQELYKKHGMAHPSLRKKAEAERRSRSPMLPGPRKEKSFKEEQFDKYLAERYPMEERFIHLHFMDGYHVIKDRFPEMFDMVDAGFWKNAVTDDFKPKTSTTTSRHIYPWEQTHPPLERDSAGRWLIPIGSERRRVENPRGRGTITGIFPGS